MQEQFLKETIEEKEKRMLYDKITVNKNIKAKRRRLNKLQKESRKKNYGN